ncbi:hypothetical protein LCGC14_3079550, partial [marine sediment metagenome]
MIKIIRSPLRYPGGKSKALSKIIEFLPEEISEYREPFVGGGSLFIYMRQKYPDVIIKINDKNKDVYCFWKIARDKNDDLIQRIKEIKKDYKNGKDLFYDLRDQLVNNKISEFERAVGFFILNRISFSGLTTSGGFSKESFKKRFTSSSLERVALLKEIMEGVIITHGDYSNLLNGKKRDVLIYLDPPYLSSEKSKLYGQNGNLHFKFDHQTLKEKVLACNHNILLSYDNSNLIKHSYEENNDFNLFTLTFQYGMNNIYRGRIPKSKELVIINYASPLVVDKSLNSCKQIKNKSFIQYVSDYIENFVKVWKSERKLMEDIK